jgi:hypothetical protein
MNPIPYAASFILGMLTALGLWLLTMALSLGEMGGPINWAVWYLVIIALMLGLAAYTARAKAAPAGAICGILFSVPVAVVCYLISHTDATVLREHGHQLKFAGIAAVVLSVLLMAGIGQLRKMPDRSNAGTRGKKF